MLDDKGNEIDLDFIDAIGELPDGRFDVWLQNDRRVVTANPSALEIWHDHIRRRVYAKEGDRSPNLLTNPAAHHSL